jgi:hypothetical protein
VSHAVSTTYEGKEAQSDSCYEPREYCDLWIQCAPAEFRAQRYPHHTHTTQTSTEAYILTSTTPPNHIHLTDRTCSRIRRRSGCMYVIRKGSSMIRFCLFRTVRSNLARSLASKHARRSLIATISRSSEKTLASRAANGLMSVAVDSMEATTTYLRRSRARVLPASW